MARRYEDGGYYEEDYAPYDREHWALLLDIIEWLELVERPEIVDGLLVAWISSGRLPIAKLVYRLRHSRGQREILGRTSTRSQGAVRYDSGFPRPEKAVADPGA
jgi:hypothetical protein